MRSPIWALSILVVTLVTVPGPAQDSQLSLTSFKITGGKTSFSIPFELVDNRIFIDVRLNGKGPYRFILDSGGYCQISLELAREINLPLGAEAQGAGVGQNVIVARETQVAELQIGDLHLTNQDLRAFSYADAGHVFGTKAFHGVIGLPVFQHLVVKVDYERQRLTLTAPSHFKYKGAGTVVPFELERFAPIVKGEVDGITTKFAIDTGSRSSLLLRTPFVESHDLRAKYAPKVEAITGWGGGGPIRSQVTRTKVLKLSSVEIYNPVTFLSLQRAGLLATTVNDAGLVGAGILKQFNVTFDYTRKQLIFEKNRNYQKSDTYDRSGMWISQSTDGKYFEVFDVVAGGPAAKAGLKVGDKILAVNGRGIERLILPSLRELLKGLPPNQTVRLLLKSGERRQEIVMTLKELV